jgi:hypothetical protein
MLSGYILRKEALNQRGRETPPGVSSISTCPIQRDTSCPLRVRFSSGFNGLTRLVQAGLSVFLTGMSLRPPAAACDGFRKTPLMFEIRAPRNSGLCLFFNTLDRFSSVLFTRFCASNS